MARTISANKLPITKITEITNKIAKVLIILIYS